MKREGKKKKEKSSYVYSTLFRMSHASVMRRKCQSLDDCSPTKVTIVRFSLLLLRYIQYAKDAIGINWFERLRWCQNSHERFNLHTKKIKVRFFFFTDEIASERVECAVGTLAFIFGA